MAAFAIEADEQALKDACIINIHRAMLTMMKVPSGYKRMCASWPEYKHEANEHGARPDLDQDNPLLNEVLTFEPRRADYDQMETVWSWFGELDWGSKKPPGIRPWEVKLLSMRAWKWHAQRGFSWRTIEMMMRDDPNAPNFSYKFFDKHYKALIHRLFLVAYQRGEIVL